MEHDKRFSHLENDPKFRRIPRAEKKVKIDKRFRSMFNDKKFSVNYSVDKRGRPVRHTSSEDLKRYYDISSDDDEHDDENQKNAIGRFVRPISEETKKCTELTVAVKKKLRDKNVDYARGESRLLSDSSSDDESTDDELTSAIDHDDTEIQHKWGELDNDAHETDQATTRLAACNMDWDRIRAVDLIVLFNSMLQSGGSIHSIHIFPSEYGKQRMAAEEVAGPSELVQKSSKTKLRSQDEDDDNILGGRESDDIDEAADEGSKFHMEKLRQYQLNRLKYYYAVIICDSVATANKLYADCDGIEYESSSTKIDLRFIPDDMTFEDEPKEACTEMPDMNKYQPRFFTTTALQQAKVNLTWDETDPNRIDVTQKLSSGKIDDLSEADLQTYLAASSSEEESGSDRDDASCVDYLHNDAEKTDDASAIDKYKAILQGIERESEVKKRRDIGMEISWGIDLKEKTDNLIKQKQVCSENKTPFQEYLQKRKEKRKEKRLTKRTESDDEESDGSIPSDVDMNDPYFAEELNGLTSKVKSKKQNRVEGISTEDASKNREELELLIENDKADKSHFSLSKLQQNEKLHSLKKNRKKRAMEESTSKDDFQINVADERFSALYSSHHFNIDPTDPHYKKTKAVEELISEKIKRRHHTYEMKVDDSTGAKERKMDAGLSVLVKSIKRKTRIYTKKGRV